jgi:hypothetical protein
LRAARVLAWTAALALAAAAAKRGAHDASEALLTSLGLLRATEAAADASAHSSPSRVLVAAALRNADSDDDDAAGGALPLSPALPLTPLEDDAFAGAAAGALACAPPRAATAAADSTTPLAASPNYSDP